MNGKYLKKRLFANLGFKNELKIKSNASETSPRTHVIQFAVAMF